MTKKVKKSLGKLTKNLKSFSLVELIIVIAIIAILSVAGFMTLTKWIGKSRNSRRISDLHTIKKGLTINYTEKGKYPTPSNNGGVNYSGSTLWKQGTFGKETIDKMDEFTTVPKDPLTKTGYDYSVTENQKEYEVSAALERIGIAYTDIRKYVDKVYAGDYYSKVLGNYDSLSLGVKTGANNCYTLSIPSIIISDFTGKNIEIEADRSKEYNFVMEGGKNIGPSYKSALKKTRKGTKFGVKSVYSECEIQNLTDFNDFSSGLHMAYSGEKITETPGFDHSIGDIGNSDEDVEVRTESYKELQNSDIITLSNDVNEQIEDDINGSEETGGGKNQINMNVDGGGSIDGPSNANTDESVELTATPDTGWKFDSWSGDECDGATSTTCSFTMPANDVNITATYSINSYTVTFKDHDGTVLDTQSVNYGGDATAPSDPSRVGYNFDGWDTSYNSITSDTTVAATYSNTSPTISSVSTSSSSCETIEFTINASDTETSDSNLEYSFDGGSNRQSSNTKTFNNTTSESITAKVRDTGGATSSDTSKSGSASSCSCTVGTTDTVSGGGETYTIECMPDGNYWTTANMKHDVSGEDTWCYNNDSSNCESDGRLYDWEAAKQACQDLGSDWHLPSDSEWDNLESEGCDGWNGNKLCGLVSVLPGYRYYNGYFYYQGDLGYRWSSTEYDSSDAWYRCLYSNGSDVNRNNLGKVDGFSVVCSKN